MLRNPKGATSLRWLQVLLDGGIEVHGQVVVCPGVNDGAALEDTLAGILDRYPGLASVGAVPLGRQPLLQRSRDARRTRPRRPGACSTRSASGSGSTRKALGHRMVFAADEYYLLAGRDLPPARSYDGFPQHENGIGMARAFVDAFARPAAGGPGGVRHGFFASVDAAPGRGVPGAALRRGRAAPGADARPITVLTGTYGARVLGPLVASHPRDDVALHAVANDFFGGNIGVAGLLTGEDVARRARPRSPTRPAACCPMRASTKAASSTASRLADLPRPVEVVPTDGGSLAGPLDGTSFRPACAA